jgi:NodT family efflux transporter outer membrane factor (OMF) lipoprotein
MKFIIKQLLSNLMIIIVLASLGLFFQCSFAPVYVKPEIQTTATFKELTPGESEGWWTMFHDPDLNVLENQAAVCNQSIAAAYANFLAARAVVKQSRSGYFPTVTTSPSIKRSRQSSLLAQPNPVSATITEYSLPFDASWELDFWGRVRNTVAASSFEAQATLDDLDNVRLIVQAEVAVDYFQLRVIDAQKRLLDTSVSTYRESLKLTKIQYNAGIASDLDIAQNETQINIALAQATDLGIQRAQLEHAIAAFIGKSASLFSIAINPFDVKPVPVPIGVPSQLLERRPDIAAAERRVAEANAQIGVARAAYFPAVTLDGSAGFLSTSIGNLFSASGFVWSIGSTLSQSLFDGGKRKAVTEQSQAIYQGTVAKYRQTVLAAFQEVEDNLSTLRILSVEIQQQNAAVESSQRYLKYANERYNSGIDSYLNVSTAQITLLTNQRTATTLLMQQMTTSVQLIKSLGGGWDQGSAMSQDSLGKNG